MRLLPSRVEAVRAPPTALGAVVLLVWIAVVRHKRLKLTGDSILIVVFIVSTIPVTMIEPGRHRRRAGPIHAAALVRVESLALLEQVENDDDAADEHDGKGQVGVEAHVDPFF